MSFTVGAFMGALLRSFSANISWGAGSPSQLTIQLVEDPAQNAYFVPSEIGTPAYFQFYNFRFYGLFQRWQQTRGIDGNPLYEVVLTDPREILDGTQVILGGYSGSVGNVRNLFNVYGFWESTGFGASLANDAGMPWYRVRDAILAMANTPVYGAYGGPLTFRGVAYSLDLSELPNPPSYYRVGGGLSMSLTDIISQICEDAGCDYFVELIGYTIRVRVISRFLQPPLGTISAIANTNWGNSVVRTSTGLECRNELTSAFVLGGNVSTLWTTSSITQYWGNDVNGSPIVGTPYVAQFYNDTGTLLYSVPDEAMTLNASPISDILGTPYYPCTTLEMRFAQTSSSSWEYYISRFKPSIAALLGLPNIYKNTQASLGYGDVPIRPNFINDAPNNVKTLSAATTANQNLVNFTRVYEFVKGYANEYLGRKYLASIPFVLSYSEPDTLNTVTSYDVSDGGFLPENVGSIGLSSANENVFKTQDGRFRAFAVYSNLAGVDLTKLSPNGTVIENGALYSEVTADERLVYAPGPCVVITINGPVMELADGPMGDSRIIYAALQLAENQGQQVLKQVAIPPRVAPGIRAPSSVSIPLRSRLLSYGPWYASGAPGKVKVEHDPSLTPWNYGSYAVMNLAAQARVISAITNQQISEAGDVELAGAPNASLGDVLVLNGPNITGIDVRVGTGGITTTYRFQTFTPRFGVIAKGINERLKRMSLTIGELRKAIRTALKEQVTKSDVVGGIVRSAQSWMGQLPPATKRETPHEVIHSYSLWDPYTSSIRQNMGSTTIEEAFALSNADSDLHYYNTSIMSINGLLRPFSTDPEYNGGMAHMVSPSISGPNPSTPILNKTFLNPWDKGTDIEMFTWGNSYAGLHAFNRPEVERTKVRAIGLRAPMILVGWGLDIEGKCVPGSQYDGYAWDDDSAIRQDKWKAGPLDTLWDERRGVWTVHDVVKGTISGVFSPGGSGLFTVVPLNGPTWTMNVWNYFSTSVSGTNTKAIASYVATDNRWYLTAVDCV